jgi:hypothetical protein
LARQTMQLSDGRKTVLRCTADSTHCAIAAYRGSRDRPDNKFADAVLTSVAKSDAPDFDMPDDVGDCSDCKFEAALDGTSLISPDADRLLGSITNSARPMAAPSRDDGLFVRRLPERRPQ